MSVTITLDAASVRPFVRNLDLAAKDYDDTGQPERAIQDFGRAIRLDPQNAMAYRNRGVGHIRGGDYQLALDDLDRAIGIDGTYAAAYLTRSCVYRAMDQQEAAAADYSRGTDLARRYPPAFVTSISLELESLCPLPK